MRIDPSHIYKKYQTATNKKEAISHDARSGSVKEGTVLKGHIIDASQNKVSIRLEDGEIMEARLTGGNVFSIGEEVSFVVKESGTDQLLITPLVDSGTRSMDQLLAILSEAGLPKSDENVEMLKAMIDKDLPIDQESLKQMSKLMIKHSKTPVKTLVFLTKHNIPVNETTIQQLQMLENNEQPLMKSMASLVDDLTNTMQQPAQSSDPTLNITVATTVSDKQEALMALMTDDQEAMTYIKEVDEQIHALAKVSRTAVQSSGQESSMGPTTETVITASKETLMETIIETLTQSSDKPITQMVLAGDGQRLIANLETAMHPALEQGGLTEVQQNVLDKLPPSSELTLLDFVQLAKVELISHEQLRVFMTEIKEAGTYQALAKGLLLSDLQVVENGDVTAWFEEVQEKVQHLLNASNEAIVSNEVTKGAINVKSTVEFMNNLQQDYQFMQLPMFLNDQLMTSEFYVMNQQKATKDQQESITALVRLDLLNLGHTDIYVKKVDKNVDIQFYMTDESQISVMQEHVFKLHKLLRDKGFNTLSATVQPLEQSFDLVNDFLDKGEASPIKKRYSFDMRA